MSHVDRVDWFIILFYFLEVLFGGDGGGGGEFLTELKNMDEILSCLEEVRT